MAYHLRISLFSSLDFQSDWQHNFEKQECFNQYFASSDTIRVQFAAFKNDTPTVRLTGLDTEDVISIPLTEFAPFDNYRSYYFEITDLDTGTYKVDIINTYQEVISSSVFCVMEKECLYDTILLKYTNREDKFDTQFLDGDGGNYFFEFRIRGGFLFKEMTFNVSNNTFRDQGYSLTQLDAYPYESRILTIGDNSGVPIWIARKLNLMFSLSYITINGLEYVRADGTEVEVNELAGYYPGYIFKLEVEPKDFYSSYEDLYPNGYNIHTKEFIKPPFN
ncbi:hypothetical protein GGR21_002452 [Dysgonomonas hofstadii]|uniref:Uncharacterized protein n=1 Tax=Dysgonomonas hofstadii TaxID=637886 RepID=A0A840CMD2_9BACT|nr:hypothetical protein [Dysgonomonas hofstadii]MBB4036546.1 hypothetical protein [Dysgonomonas hofstadii]